MTQYERGQCGGDRGVLSGDERSGSARQPDAGVFTERHGGRGWHAELHGELHGDGQPDCGTGWHGGDERRQRWGLTRRRATSLRDPISVNRADLAVQKNGPASVPGGVGRLRSFQQRLCRGRWRHLRRYASAGLTGVTRNMHRHRRQWYQPVRQCHGHVLNVTAVASGAIPAFPSGGSADHRSAVLLGQRHAGER